MLENPVMLTLNQLREKGYKIERNNTHLLTVFSCYDPKGEFIDDYNTLPETLEALNTHLMVNTPHDTILNS